MDWGNKQHMDLEETQTFVGVAYKCEQYRDMDF